MLENFLDVLVCKLIWRNLPNLLSVGGSSEKKTKKKKSNNKENVINTQYKTKMLQFVYKSSYSTFSMSRNRWN